MLNSNFKDFVGVAPHPESKRVSRRQPFRHVRGPTATHSSPPAERLPTAALRDWMEEVRTRTEQYQQRLLDLPDEEHFAPAWAAALRQVRAYTLRPSKKLRPALVAVGYTFGRGAPVVPEAVWRFAAALELLHNFMLIHDDVADRAELRRGAASLHTLLAPGRLGEDLAIVSGDHLFARAIEVMLSCELPNVSRAVSYLLRVCRHTAAGQHLDLQSTQVPLSDFSIFQSLKIAHLKTALYGFSAPLVCGALLAGADPALLDTLERLGRHIGLAFQLQDDLIGLYGETSDAGKSISSDLEQGKRTLAVVAAYSRADEATRRQLDVLWTPGAKSRACLAMGRYVVERCGGRDITERLIARATRRAQGIAATLPDAGGMRALMGQILATLVGRKS